MIIIDVELIFMINEKKSLNLIICVYGRIDVFTINSINRLCNFFKFIFSFYTQAFLLQN